MNHSLSALMGGVCLALTSHAALQAGPAVEAVTFAVEPGVLYVPLNEAARQLRWELQLDESGRFADAAVPAGSLRRLVDGTELIRASDLQLAGAVITTDADDGKMTIRKGFRRFTLAAGGKRVEISLAAQRLRAWQGGRLVLESRISSGRKGSTPAGSFTAGPYKARMHYSSRYQNAPMPWSVQIHGHVFIHGFTSVPDYPASHGCIRLPLNEGNPARFFYEWVDNGTPVRVTRD